MLDQPLIWTTKGNLPASELAYETAWEEGPLTPLGPLWVKFVERHLLEGEVVKESCHVYNREGLLLGASVST